MSKPQGPKEKPVHPPPPEKKRIGPKQDDSGELAELTLPIQPPPEKKWIGPKQDDPVRPQPPPPPEVPRPEEG